MARGELKERSAAQEHFLGRFQSLTFSSGSVQLKESMKGFFPLLLLLGALLGLFGQGMALAAAPASLVTQAVPAEAEPDCMKMMQEAPDGQPCKGITLDCIAAMGCVVPFTLADEQPALNAPVLAAGVELASIVMPLSGRVPSLEPEPPTS